MRPSGDHVMTRHLVPMIVGCLYVLGAAMVVRHEGQSYRDGLGRSGGSAEATATRTDRDGVAEGAAETAEPPPRPEPRAVVANRLSEAPASNTAIALKPNPSPPAAAPPAGGLAIAATPPAEAARGLADPDGAILKVKDDPIWGGPELERSWNLDRLTREDEAAIGERLNAIILKFNPDYTGPELRRVKEAAEPLRREAASRGMTYQFFVLDSDVANAFSHPGGYIYLSRKLVDLLPEDENYLLEFVIGHEMAHVELHHALACLRSPSVRKFSDGILPKLYTLIIPHGYFDNFETAADDWAYHEMSRRGRTNYECLKFLKMLDRYARANNFDARRGKPEELFEQLRRSPAGERAFSPIDNHLRAHPPAFERLRHLQELALRKK